MHRLLVSTETLGQPTIRIRDPDAVHHLKHVCRVAQGERLECFDGQGRAAAGHVTETAKNQFVLSVDSRRTVDPKAVSVSLFQAVIRPERFEWVLEKATELGIDRIIPTVTQRCVSRHGPSAARLKRWKRILEGAAAQCGRLTLPVLEQPALFEGVLSDSSTGQKLIATLAVKGRSMKGIGLKRGKHRAVHLFIGPEGDFTPSEAQQALEAGALPLTLGETTLRAETAALAALTLLQHRLGSM